MPKPTNPTPTRGGYRWSLPAEERKTSVMIGLDPDVLKLLEPFTKAGRRGQIVNQAVRRYLEKGATDERPDTD